MVLDLIESSRIEFKIKMVDNLEETIIAFLNSKDGGIIYLGINDKGKIIGLGLVTEEEYNQLHAGTCTDFTFKLGGLLVLIPQVVTSGSSTFNLAVSDGVNTKDGDITVIVNPKEGE